MTKAEFREFLLAQLRQFTPAWWTPEVEFRESDKLQLGTVRVTVEYGSHAASVERPKVDRNAQRRAIALAEMSRVVKEKT